VSYHYHDDPVEETAVRSILPKFIAACLLMIFSFVYYQTTLAANINLNSGRSVEFGQSVSTTTACSGSDSLVVTPNSTFTNATNGTGSYYLTSVKVSGIPASCNGKDINISFYDSATGSSALPLFSFFGENRRVATVYNNAGYSLKGFEGSGTEVSSSSGSFTVTFKTPAALSTDAMKVTLQSTEHKNWAEASISSGPSFTCTLLYSSGMKCWGRNNEGSLGTGGGSSNTPVNVSGLSSGVTAITTGGQPPNGGRWACAVLDTGAVKCWGWNGNGQLGVGNALNNYGGTPTDVIGLPARAVDVKAGYVHTCILLITGSVECTGRGYEGQLGYTYTGGPPDRTSPDPVSNITNAVAISAGGNNSCALLSTGAVQCWGANANGAGGQSNTPVGVSGISSGVTAIATGVSHSCALLSTGAVKCWGVNSSGQLGNNTTTTSWTPVSVSGITNAVAISAGASHTCALLSTGAMQCWGDNTSGQLGDGSLTQRNTPVGVSGLTSGIRAIGTGTDHSCAVLSTGAARCWGNNASGQLGTGTTNPHYAPEVVAGIP
jgi:hypothetical protein